MRKSNSTWKDHATWQCLNHIPPLSLPAAAARCWMKGCSERPTTAAPPPPPEPEPVPEPEVMPVMGEICAWEPCNKAARPQSKYCSRQCSNRNARKRHRMRNRNRDAA